VAVHAVGMSATLDWCEAVLLEDAAQVFRCLELLVAKLPEAKNLIDHLLRHRPHAIDICDNIPFGAVNLFRGHDG
jgi:hypothetical protein